MAKKISEGLAVEMEALRAEIKLITDNDESSTEDIARADTLLDEFSTKKESYDKAIAREEQVAEVMRASLYSGNREGSGPKSTEYMKRTEAFTDGSQRELSRSLSNGDYFDRTDAISRASAAVEGVRLNDESKEHLTELLEDGGQESAKIARHILLTGSDEYREEFKSYFSSNGSYVGEALRTAMSLTGGNGGYMSPYFVDPTIILTNSGNVNPLRQIARVDTITSNVWHGVSSAGVTAEWTSEGTQFADASPTFVQPTVTCHKADAYLLGSYEMLSDTGFDSQVAMLMADAKSNLEATAFQVANTGATIPRGVMAGVLAVTASIVTSATTGAFVVGDLHNVVNATTARSQNNLTILAHKNIASKIRQFDTAGGGMFWANLGPGIPPVLLGSPYYQASSLDSTVASGKNIVLVGDFKQYLIVDRIGMSVLYNPLVLGANQRPSGQAGFACYWRVGADVLNADAFRVLQLNQTAAAVALA